MIPSFLSFLYHLSPLPPHFHLHRPSVQSPLAASGAARTYSAPLASDQLGMRAVEEKQMEEEEGRGRGGGRGEVEQSTLGTLGTLNNSVTMLVYRVYHLNPYHYSNRTTKHFIAVVQYSPLLPCSNQLLMQ